jgi:hypothetical protein
MPMWLAQRTGYSFSLQAYFVMYTRGHAVITCMAEKETGHIVGTVPSASSNRWCRDRTAARATLGGEFPTLALSIREVGS